MIAWAMNLGFAAGPSTDQAGISSLLAFWAGGGGVSTATIGNIVFGQSYYMIHPPQEAMLRPTSVTELTIRKRDKKPIISGGDH